MLYHKRLLLYTIRKTRVDDRLRMRTARIHASWRTSNEITLRDNYDKSTRHCG